jgi:hypothetical protein
MFGTPSLTKLKLTPVTVPGVVVTPLPVGVVDNVNSSTPFVSTT